MEFQKSIEEIPTCAECMSLGSKRHLKKFVDVLETTFLGLGGPLPKSINMYC
jgi:hypothetical protein